MNEMFVQIFQIKFGPVPIESRTKIGDKLVADDGERNVIVFGEGLDLKEMWRVALGCGFGFRGCCEGRFGPSRLLRECRGNPGRKRLCFSLLL